MRISDWSSDVCSFDLNQSSKGLSMAATLAPLATDVGGKPLICCGFSPVLSGEEIRLRVIVLSCVPIELRSEAADRALRSEEHTSELQSLMRISYDVFCLKKKKIQHKNHQYVIN